MATRRRGFQIGEKIRMAVASQLARTADPRFSLVTITSVVVSPDLRHAKIYWLVTGDEERRAEVKEAFESAAGMFRRAIGAELGLRFVPEIRFYYDDTLDTAEEVERLFARINADSGK
ncbi:MAG: 30S ribosome-binding factor RbfA [Oligoflexia bacterium]|nr:30S ribosome-binding factor RbfA [Oligoflexia bacterium]